MQRSVRGEPHQAGLLGQVPVITINPMCQKYKITAERSHEQCQKHVW